MLRSVGLGFRPMPPEENVESTLIWYRGTDSENFKHWVDSLQNFLKGIRNKEIYIIQDRISKPK